MVTRSQLLQTWCHLHVNLVYLTPFQSFTADLLIIVTASCASSYSSICFTGTPATFREDVNKSMTLLSPAPSPSQHSSIYALDILSSLSISCVRTFSISFSPFLSLSPCLSFSLTHLLSLTPSPFLSLCPPSFHSRPPHSPAILSLARDLLSYSSLLTICMSGSCAASILRS